MKTSNVDQVPSIGYSIGLRLLGGWILSILGCFIALRLAAYLGMYGCLGLVILLVPAVALYNGWKPWIRYIMRGE